MPIAGWRTSTGVPQSRQNWRWLASVFLNTPSRSSPRTTRTLSVGQSAAAWIGAPSQPRHELQWQYAITAGSPLISVWTFPHTHLLDFFASAINHLLISVAVFPISRGTRARASR